MYRIYFDLRYHQGAWIVIGKITSRGSYSSMKVKFKMHSFQFLISVGFRYKYVVFYLEL